eukprot:6260387-Prymnesium_polylepis.2
MESKCHSSPGCGMASPVSALPSRRRSVAVHAVTSARQNGCLSVAHSKLVNQVHPECCGHITCSRVEPAVAAGANRLSTTETAAGDGRAAGRA